MEGGEGGGNFPYGNNNFHQRNLPDFQPKPPLTSAIDKFLWGQNYNFSQQEIPANFNNKEAQLFQENLNYGFFPSSSEQFGEINNISHASGEIFPWPTTTTTTTHSPHQGAIATTFSHGIFLNEVQRNPNWIIPEINPGIFGLRMDDDEENLAERLQRGNLSSKRENGGSSSTANMIKGQWTEDEDNKLRSLIEDYGEKKWAEIAKKMEGRIGKQCRERWHNHLRPDIKKDSWSEEEESLFIEAHMKLGNKWAEIAKLIPGRTENSIKNHWNATKRKLNSSKKMKKPQVQIAKKKNTNNQSTLLQDYIKSSCNISNDSTSTPTSSNPATPTTTPTPPDSAVSEDPTSLHINMLDHQGFDDHEMMNFMGNMFGTSNYNNPPKGVSFGHHENIAKAKAPLIDHQGFDGNNMEYGGGIFPSFVESKYSPTKTHLSSDLYLSRLLDGANVFNSQDQGFQGYMNMENMMDHDQAGSRWRK